MRTRYAAPGTGRTAICRSLCWLPMAVGAAVLLPGAAFGSVLDYVSTDAASGGSPFAYEVDPTAVDLDLDDDAFIEVTLPFAFPFDDVSYSTVQVHSNGAISFSATAAISWEHECPAVTPAGPFVLPYWTDLNPTQATTAGAGVYAWDRGTDGDRVFVVEWFEIPQHSVTGGVTLEAKLFEADGRIEFHYSKVDVEGSDYDNGARSAIGLAAAGEHLAVSCDSSSISAGTALTFSLPGCDDLDGDGVPGCEGDCDDSDPDVRPGALEVCNGVDDDCSGNPDLDEADADGDGFRICEDDCDDGDAELTPADDDGDGVSSCDGDCDDDDAAASLTDADADGSTGCDEPADCDDEDAALNRRDDDGDGVDSCDGDCDDEDPRSAPDTPEFCDGVDNDCNGEIDDNPNCGDGDDDDSVELPPIPYGCLLACDQSGGAPSGLLLLGLVGFARRRR